MLRYLLAAAGAMWSRWSPSAPLFLHCASNNKSSPQPHRISGVRAIQRAAAKRRNQRRSRR